MMDQSITARRRPISNASDQQQQKEQQQQSNENLNDSRVAAVATAPSSVIPRSRSSPPPSPTPAFPSTFLPFLRSSAKSKAGLTFESLLAYWSCHDAPDSPTTTATQQNDNDYDPNTSSQMLFFSLSLQSFPWSLDRALRRDWTTARSLLLNGVFLEQIVQFGGIRNVSNGTTDNTDKGREDQRLLFGHWYSEIGRIKTNEDVMKYLVGRMDREEMERVMKKHACGVQILRGRAKKEKKKGKGSSISEKRPAAPAAPGPAAPASPPLAATASPSASPDLEPESPPRPPAQPRVATATSAAPFKAAPYKSLKPKKQDDSAAISPKDVSTLIFQDDPPKEVTIVLRDENASNKGDIEATRAFVIKPDQRIRDIFATYARRRGVPLRSLRFTLPIQCEADCVEDAENLTPERLGLEGRVEVICSVVARPSPQKAVPGAIGGSAARGVHSQQGGTRKREKLVAVEHEWKQPPPPAEASRTAMAREVEEPTTPKTSNTSFFSALTPAERQAYARAAPPERQQDGFGYGTHHPKQQAISPESQQHEGYGYMTDSLGRPYKTHPSSRQAVSPERHEGYGYRADSLGRPSKRSPPRQAVAPPPDGQGLGYGRTDSQGRPYKKSRLANKRSAATPGLTTTATAPQQPPSHYVPVTPMTPCLQSSETQDNRYDSYSPKTYRDNDYDEDNGEERFSSSYDYYYPKSCLKTPKFSSPRYDSQFLPSPRYDDYDGSYSRSPPRSPNPPTTSTHRGHRKAEERVVDLTGGDDEDGTIFYKDQGREERKKEGQPSLPPTSRHNENTWSGDGFFYEDEGREERRRQVRQPPPPSRHNENTWSGDGFYYEYEGREQRRQMQPPPPSRYNENTWTGNSSGTATRPDRRQPPGMVGDLRGAGDRNWNKGSSGAPFAAAAAASTKLSFLSEVATRALDDEGDEDGELTL